MVVKHRFTFVDMDENTRAHMVEEIERAARNGEHVVSSQLVPGTTKRWTTEWPKLLAEAATSRDEDWLAQQLVHSRLMDNPSAATLIADQHFKRFYIAAICRRAIEMRLARVWVYRARQSNAPRAESVALIGKEQRPAELLETMRFLAAMHECDLTKPGSGLAVALTPPADRQ